MRTKGSPAGWGHRIEYIHCKCVFCASILFALPRLGVQKWAQKAYPKYSLIQPGASVFEWLTLPCVQFGGSLQWLCWYHFLLLLIWPMLVTNCLKKYFSQFFSISEYFPFHYSDNTFQTSPLGTVHIIKIFLSISHWSLRLKFSSWH